MIHDCISGETHEQICELEMKYIKEYRERTGCYNISDGGDGGLSGRKLSDSTKKKIGEKNRVNMTGRKASKETKAKMSAAQKKRYKSLTDEDRKAYGEKMSACASGYHWSDEQKKRFAEKQKLHPNGAKYTLDTVKEIRRLYDECGMSVSDIANKLGIIKGTVYNIATRRRWKNID